MRDRPPERTTDSSGQSSGGRQTSHDREASAAHQRQRQRQRSSETDGDGGGNRQQSVPDTNQSETPGQTQSAGGHGPPSADELARLLCQAFDNGQTEQARRRQKLRDGREKRARAEREYIAAVQGNAPDTSQRWQTLATSERLVKLLERGLPTERAQQQEQFNTKRDTALLAAAAHLSDPVIHETRDVTAPPGELERYRRNQDRLNQLARERQNRQRLLDNPTEAGLSRFGVANVQAERDQISAEEEMLDRERHDMEADDYRRGIDIRDRTYAATRLRLAASDIPGPVPAISEPTQPRFQRYSNPSLQGILADMRQSQDPNRAVEHLRQRGYYRTLDQDYQNLDQGQIEQAQYTQSQEAAMILSASMPTLFSSNIAYWLSPEVDHRRPRSNDHRRRFINFGIDGMEIGNFEVVLPEGVL